MAFTRTFPERNTVERIRTMRTRPADIAYNHGPGYVPRPQDWTLEDEAIANDLGHVAFMAWLTEARDGNDARYMRLLCAARSVGRDCMQTIILQGD